MAVTDKSLDAPDTALVDRRRSELFHQLCEHASATAPARDAAITSILRTFEERNDVVSAEAYILKNTVDLCSIDLANVLLNPDLQLIWERVEERAEACGDDIEKKRKRKVDQMVGAANGRAVPERDYVPDIWRHAFFVMKTWGVELAVHCGWIPLDQSASGRMYISDAKQGAVATPDVRVATRRLNVAAYAQMRTRGRLKTSKFTEGRCLVLQSHLKNLKRWEGGKLEVGGETFPDEELTEAQLNEIGCERDDHGLLRYRRHDVPPQSASAASRDRICSTRSSRKITAGACEPTGAKGDAAVSRAQQRVAQAASNITRIRTATSSLRGTGKRRQNEQTRSRAAPKTILGDSDWEVLQESCSALQKEYGRDGRRRLAGREAHMATSADGHRSECSTERDEVNQQPSPSAASTTSEPISSCAIPSWTELQQDFEHSKRNIVRALSRLKELAADQRLSDEASHHELAIRWVERARLPRIGDVNDIRRGNADVDLVRLSDRELGDLLDAGHTIDLPVILRDQLHERSRPDIRGYMNEMIRSGERVEVQRCGAQATKRIAARQALDAFEVELSAPTRYAADTFPTNLLNLRDLAEVRKPAFLENGRWRLLKVLNRRARSDAGKQTTSRPTDITSCESFNLLASICSFSKPHVDMMGGTWVRVVNNGLKAWMMASAPTESDWSDFEHHPAMWVPPMDKTVMVLLQRGDVLVMPPGRPQIHAPLTLAPCLMDGGMFADWHRIVKFLQDLLWVALRPSTTNEPIPQELPVTLKSLKEIVEVEYRQFQGESGDNFREHFWKAYESFSETLACGCNSRRGGCDTSHCPCHRRGSRCTNLCRSHGAVIDGCKRET